MKLVKNTYLAGADGIRGLAVLIVLCMHAVSVFFPATMPYLTGCGKIGVWLFFVLSAFLLAYKFITHTFSFTSIVSYCIGRCIRILPLFVLAVFIYSLAGYYPLHEAFNIISFQYGFGHLWTIPVEFKFYFLLPFFTFSFLLINKKLGSRSLIFSLVIIILMQQYFFPFYQLAESNIATLWYLPSFLMGIVTAIIYAQKNIKLTDAGSDVLITIVIAFIILSSPGARYVLLNIEMTKDLMKQFIPLSFAWSIIILLSINSHGIWGKIMKLTALKKLGHWSFSIYLFHWVIYLKLADKFINNYYAMFSAFFISIAIGAIFYHFIESNIEKFRRKLMHKITSTLIFQSAM